MISSVEEYFALEMMTLSIAIISVLKAISIGKGLTCDIIVVDIDERLTKFIKLTGINENYPIDTVLGNL